MEKKENVIVAYKGFDKDLKCRGFQYEFGKEYEEPKAEACECGFHACEYPLDVFGYYPPGSSRYCNVEQSGDIDKRNSDKTCSTKIKIGAEIGIAGLIKAAIEYTKSKCTNEYNAEPGEPATAGEYGAARESTVQPQRAIEVRRQRAIEVQPQRAIEVQPQRDTQVQPQREIEVQPQRDTQVQPQRESTVQPGRVRCSHSGQSRCSHITWKIVYRRKWRMRCSR